MKPPERGPGKVQYVMNEFGKGDLHSGSKTGPKVSNPKQAIAIALNQAGLSNKAGGGAIRSLTRGLKPKGLRMPNFAEEIRRPGGMATGGAVRGDGAASKGHTKGTVR